MVNMGKKFECAQVTEDLNDYGNVLLHYACAV